jgi:hypothetical protein
MHYQYWTIPDTGTPGAIAGEHELPESTRYQLEEIRSCATAVMRMAPDENIARMASAVANVAQMLGAKPWDEDCRQALVTAVSALRFALEGATEERPT